MDLKPKKREKVCLEKGCDKPRQNPTARCEECNYNRALKKAAEYRAKAEERARVKRLEDSKQRDKFKKELDQERGELTYGALIESVDRIFSHFVRLTDADDMGNCTCISCGRSGFWKNLDNGHFVNRSVMYLRFDKRNCHPQCKYCNQYKEGNSAGYSEGIKNKLGEQTLKDLAKQSKILMKWTRPELEEMKEQFKIEVKKLKKLKDFR